MQNFWSLTLSLPPFKPLEDFQKVPLLRDRLFLEEKRRIQEELDSRCSTPEVFPVPDSEKNIPPYWIPSVYPREPILRVERPLLLREDVSSSQPIVFNPPIPPTPAKPSLRFNSATSAFTLRSPVQQPIKSVYRLPTNTVRCAPRVETQTLQRLFNNNDFLSPTPLPDLASASTKKSTFVKVNSNTFDSSYKLQQKNLPGLYPERDYSLVNNESEPLFLFEKAPKINPLHKVISQPISSLLTRKKSSKTVNRRAQAPQKASTIALSKPGGFKSTLKISTKPPSISAEIAEAEDDLSYMEESDLISEHLSDTEDIGEVVENLPNVEGMEISPYDEATFAALTEGTAPVIPPAATQPLIDLNQQVAHVLKQTMSSGINLQNPLFIIDTVLITGEQALKFQNQANQWHDNFSLQQVIVPPATSMVQFAMQSDSEFNLLQQDLIPQWVTHLTVKQAAQLITKYFGDKRDTGMTIVEQFAKIPLDFNFSDPTSERETFVALSTLTRAFEIKAPITAAQHAALIVTIEKKLKPDSQLKTDYFELKKTQAKPDEKWETAFTRLTACVIRVRRLNEQIAQYGSMTKGFRLALKDSSTQYVPVQTPALYVQQPSMYSAAIMPYAAPQQVIPPIGAASYSAEAYKRSAEQHNEPTPSVATKRKAGGSPLQLLPRDPCRSCGHSDHEVKNCPVLFWTDANNELTKEWEDSLLGKEWARHGFTAHDQNTALPSHQTRYLVRPQSEFHVSMLHSKKAHKKARFQETSSSSATGGSGQLPNSHYKNQRLKQAQGIQITLADLLAATQSKIDVDTHFLSSWIFIDQRSKGNKAKARGTHPTSLHSPQPSLTPNRKVRSKILLDTGSLPGDFISQDLVHKLHGENFVYITPHPLTVCSGLDNTCYVRDQVIDIGLTFVTHSLVIKTIYLTVRLIPTKIDLIIGRQTLKKLNFFSMTPYEIGMPNIRDPVERLELLNSAEFIPLDSDSTLEKERCQHSGKGIGMGITPSTDRVANCHRAGCASQSSAVGSESTREDCDCVSIHGGVTGICTYTLAHICDPSSYTVTDTRVETPSGIVISSDEIDNEKSDTFSPFVSEQSQQDSPPIRPEDFLSLIIFEGTESQIKDLQRLCLKYAHIFSDKLAAKPAKLPPFVIKANKRLWMHSKNRTAVRLQTVRKEREIKRAIDEMLRSGVIEKSDAVYYSHPVIVQKTAELYRFCIDYRNLNKCTEASSYPLPNIRALLERIGHYQPDTFGVIDLTSGYHQAPMDEKSKILTAFICFCGIYQFTRLPFGPRQAPSYFQEMMAKFVLNGLIYTKCEMYLDDCIVYAKGHEEFLERLELVFQRFEKFGLFLKAKKCRFGMKQIEYVGRTISSAGISMSRQKIDSVLNFPKPKTLTAIRSFLGLANYFRNFVPFHSDLVAPLQKMVDPNARKKSSIVWSKEADEAYFKIRSAIAACPLLHFLDEESPIELYTDASDYGIGGVLFQVVNGNKKPISFVSKSLSASQTKWSTIQKEAYAIYFCCKQLDSLLRDRTFKIFTDHKNLTFLQSDPSHMVSRWQMALQELAYTVEYVSGSKNYLADAMSRLCPNLTPVPVVLQDTTSATATSETILSAIHETVPVTDDQLELIEMSHNSMVGHGGVDRTLNKLQSLEVDWPDMKTHVKNFIRDCACCQKMSVIKLPVHIHKYTTSTYRPFDTVNIDYIGPFPDNGYVLVMICSFTRWTELYWCDNDTAHNASQCLLQYFGRFGAPSMIRSDRGSHFMNDIVREFLTRTGTPHNLTLAYSKQENAIVERVNKEVNRHLRAFTFDSANLESYKLCLPFVQRIINSAVHSSTGASPAALLFGNQLNLDRGILIKFPETDETPTSASKIIADMLLIQKQLNDNAVNRLMTADAQHLASNTESETVFENGSYVLALNPKGPETRLHCKWLGPFKVLKSNRSEYTLLNLITKKTREVHASQLKTFRFDPAKTPPADIARRDYMEFFIENILSHKGDKKKPSTMTFLVKWLNYDSTHNTWEPWKALRTTDQLHAYLRENNMSKVIPKECLKPSTIESP